MARCGRPSKVRPGQKEEGDEGALSVHTPAGGVLHHQHGVTELQTSHTRRWSPLVWPLSRRRLGAHAHAGGYIQDKEEKEAGVR